jgi:hypothetical protein
VKRSESFIALARTYKQLNAPFGQFAMDVLKSSTFALASNDAGDATYTSIEGKIQSLTSQRDAVSTQMKALLQGATFNGQSFSDRKAWALIAQGLWLMLQAHALPH